jgi:hypothetical protein
VTAATLAVVAGAVAGPVAGAAAPTPAQVLALDVAGAHPEFHLLGAHSFRTPRTIRDAVGDELSEPLERARARRVDIVGFDGSCDDEPGSLQLTVFVVASGSSARAAILLRTLRASVRGGGAVLRAASTAGEAGSAGSPEETALAPSTRRGGGRFEGGAGVIMLGAHELFDVRLVRDGTVGIGGIGTVVATRVRSSVLVVSAMCTVGGARNVPLDDVAAVAQLHAASLAGAVLEHLDA